MAKQNDKPIKTIEEQLGINKNEILWLQYSVDSKLKYLITSDKFRDTYYLYEVVDGQAVKSKYKSETPDLLYKWIKE